MVPARRRSAGRSARGHHTALSGSSATHCLIVLVRLVRLTRAHSAKQVKLIYARLPGLGAAGQKGFVWEDWDPSGLKFVRNSI